MARVSDGVPARPTRPAPGSVSSGAASHPAASPAADASRARTTYSVSSTTATRRGEPPTADLQDPLLVLHHLVVRGTDVLPRLQDLCGVVRREVGGDERRSGGRVGQPQVHD